MLYAPHPKIHIRNKKKSEEGSMVLEEGAFDMLLLFKWQNFVHIVFK